MGDFTLVAQFTAFTDITLSSTLIY